MSEMTKPEPMLADLSDAEFVERYGVPRGLVKDAMHCVVDVMCMLGRPFHLRLESFSEPADCCRIELAVQPLFDDPIGFRIGMTRDLGTQYGLGIEGKQVAVNMIRRRIDEAVEWFKDALTHPGPGEP